MFRTRIDLANQHFGKLSITSFAYIKGSNAFWNAVCDCGNICIINGPAVKKGRVSSCGCLKMRDVKGQKLGEFLVIKFWKIKNNLAYWICKCSCGKICKVAGTYLINGSIRSCGHIRIDNLAGKQFGDLIVLDKYIRKNRITFWQVKCKCGVVKYVQQGNLVSGCTTSCGCWKNDNKIDLIGLRLGRYIVVSFSHTDSKENNYLTYWNVKCDCGIEKILSRAHLLSDKPQSCGCLAKENHVKESTTHGFCVGTPIQKAFVRLYYSMMQRCYNPNNPSYKDYGGRGIRVCDRWLEINGKGFLNFVKDRFDEYRIRRENNEIIKLDRYPNNDGNYGPENTRWATHKQNCQHTRVSSATVNPKMHKFWRNRLGCKLSSLMAARQKTSPIIEEYLGCLSEEFKKYIESLWTEGMSWDNYGYKGWTIDHINPVNRFDLSIEEDRYRCYNKFNLQPMWWPDNAKLRTKISKESIPA